MSKGFSTSIIYLFIYINLIFETELILVFVIVEHTISYLEQ